MEKFINIEEFDYHLDENRIAKFPMKERDSSKLLIYKGKNISHTQFKNISNVLPNESLIIRNNTKVIHARLVFFRESGARIEIFCLEPYFPADYELAFSSLESVDWVCMVGNLKKWKEDRLKIDFEVEGQSVSLVAERVGEYDGNQVVRFTHNLKGCTFGEILEFCGKIPIPPYLRREAELSDNVTYQTTYSKFEGSVAAPTAGLHFTDEVFKQLENNECVVNDVTLHVGAGTFLPVKVANAAEHSMHIEHFDVSIDVVRNLLNHNKDVVAIGTTSVRTIESLSVIAYRIICSGNPDLDRSVGQWEAYDMPEDLTKAQLLEALVGYMESNNLSKIKASTKIMITPGYKFKFINILVTNFHQPQSTLLLLISAVVGVDVWKVIYKYAFDNDFRFLSFGDSSVLFLSK